MKPDTQSIIFWLESIDKFMWNSVLIATLLCVGIYFTIRLKGMQFKYLSYALRLAFTRRDDKAEGDISQFEALMTTLAATIGIGSIAGVATAICSGGFGAIFWMWVIALIGMTTKYAEAILAVKFREQKKNKEMAGGPMYYLKKGLGWNKLAIVFSICCILSSFAGGNLIQANSIALAIKEFTGLPPYFTGAIFACITALVLIGGIKSIAKFSSWFVPIMAILYLGSGLFIIFSHLSFLPQALLHIFRSAFTGEAVCGGFMGASFMAALQFGIARGISSNEAGLGSAPIAAAAAKTDYPGRQALISMTSVFISSIVVCTITALVISLTGVLGSVDEQGKLLNGAPLVMQAFSRSIKGGEAIVAISIVLFGYTTILGWAYYGEQSMEFLGLSKIKNFYRLLFSLATLIGSILSLEVVWPLADIMNGLMAFPNLLGLMGLSSVVFVETKAFFAQIEKEKAFKLGG